VNHVTEGLLWRANISGLCRAAGAQIMTRAPWPNAQHAKNTEKSENHDFDF